MRSTKDDDIRISLAGTSERGRARLEAIVSMVSTFPSMADLDGAAGEQEHPAGPRVVDDELHVPFEDASAVYSTLVGTDDVCLLAIANRLHEEIRSRHDST